MDISKYTTKPASIFSNTSKPKSKIVDFCIWLASQNTRITYKAIDTIRAGRERAGMPHYHDILGAIPGDLQWVVCNAQGKYAGKPLELWAHVAPEGFMEFEYIKPEMAVEAYADWLAGEALAAE